MKIWLSIACCLALIGLADLIPPDVLLASAAHLWWLRVIALVAVAVDARLLRVSVRTAGLGKRGWVFWLMMIALPIAAVPWYLTMRESLRDGGGRMIYESR